MTGVLLDVCGSHRNGDPCRGRVLVTAEHPPLIEGECEKCGAPFAIPALKASPHIRKQRRLEHADLPTALAAKRFEETPENRPALELIRSWLVCYSTGPLPAPAIWGDAGVGKTHLLVAACRKLIAEHDTAVLFRSARSLLRELSAFDDEPARSAAWQRAVTVPVLALDDLGAQQQTDWRHDQLADLIDERYQAERPILVATNFPPGSWPLMLDARTASRLRGMTFPVELEGFDRRVTPTSEGAAQYGQPG